VLDRLDVVLATVLDAGADWIDVLLDGRAKGDVLASHAPRIAAERRCVVTGAGLHPGLAAVLVRAVASRFDVLARARVAQLIAADWAGYEFSAEAMVEFTRELTAYDASGLVNREWRTLPWWRATTVDFGTPFGRRACAPMGLEELRRLPERLPGLTDATLLMAGFNPVSDWLVMPAAMAMTLVSPRLAGPAAHLLVASLRRFGRPPYGSVAQVVGEGTGHAPVRLSVRHGDGGYWLTAAVAVATTLQYLDGTVRTPGVHVEGLVTDPVRLLADLEAWGATVEWATRRDSAPTT